MVRILATLINDQMGSFTKSERLLANYLAKNPDRLMLETNSSLADHAGVSPMTVSRFVQKIGFKNMADAKRVLKDRTYGPMTPRIRSRFEQINIARHEDEGDKEAIAAECENIRRVYAMRRTPVWKKIIRLVAHSNSIYTTGFQTTDYLARGMAMNLLYVRPDVHHLSGVDGIYAKALSDNAKTKTVIIVDIFRYGKNGPVLAKLAKECGAKVVIISDEACDWADDLSDHHLAVSTNTGFFFNSMGSIHVLMNLIVHDVVDELGDCAKSQMDTVWRAQEEFGQYL